MCRLPPENSLFYLGEKPLGCSGFYDFLYSDFRAVSVPAWTCHTDAVMDELDGENEMTNDSYKYRQRVRILVGIYLYAAPADDPTTGLLLDQIARYAEAAGEEDDVVRWFWSLQLEQMTPVPLKEAA